MSHRLLCAFASLVLAAGAWASDYGTRGGPPPANVDAIVELLRQDPYDIELLISFGTSKGGSAGHLALALRDHAPGDDLVYSANFYADRSAEHEKGFYTDELMVAIPKREYLFGTTSSLAATASFGLDFGEIYKRSVVGVRVYGLTAGEKDALAAFFRRINRDFHARARNTEYHDGEIKYDYLQLNCAKTIASAFRFGVGYEDIVVKASKFSPRRKVISALNANIPTETAMKLMKAWSARGHRIDVVLYRKYPASPYVDPHDDERIAFKDLPDRFPSVLSRDFRREAGEYEDFDNLHAMYLLYNLGRYAVQLNEQTKLLEIAHVKQPMAFRDAERLANESAKSDSANHRLRLLFRPKGTRIGEGLEGEPLQR